jgi:pimeloyl-ACP methyl ester carboxylesterase
MMQRELLGDDASLALEGVAAPVTTVVGVDDPVVDLGHLGAMADAIESVSLVRWPGDHLLPQEKPERGARFLRDLAATRGVVPAADTMQHAAQASPLNGGSLS